MTADTRTDVTLHAADGLHLAGVLDVAANSPCGVVVMAHGITADKDEDGVFTAFAELASSKGLHVLRFDFRGHGQSEGRQEDMTISGEVLDLRAALTFATARFTLPITVIAASFGAVSACSVLAGGFPASAVVLWNPVMNLQRTFLEPELPWARESFNERGFRSLTSEGYLLIDHHFRVGVGLVEEMRRFLPYKDATVIDAPVLTLHGDRDTYVSHDIARDIHWKNPSSKFVTVPGSEHGFGRLEDRAFVLKHSIAWALHPGVVWSPG